MCVRRENIAVRMIVILILCTLWCSAATSYGKQKEKEESQISSVYEEANKKFKRVDDLELNLKTRVPEVVRGRLGEGVNLQDQTQVKQFLKKSNKMFRMNETDGDFNVQKVFTDNLKMTHARVQQTHKGIPVWGSELIVHSDASGNVSVMNGRVTPDLAMDVSPAISAGTALQIAQKDLGITAYRWLNEQKESLIKEITKDPARSWKPKPELCIAPRNGDYDKGEYRLVWQMMIAVDGEKIGNYEYFIDAETGEIIFKFNSMPNEEASGISNYNGVVEFESMYHSPTSLYRMIDEQCNVYTFTFNHGDYFSYFPFPGYILTDPDNYWDENNSGVDAHWAARKTYEFYLDSLSRNSFNGYGAAIISSVNLGLNYNNAFWDGYSMYFGDGDGVEFSSLTSLDICAHEFTHGVTQYTANLIYYGESGALNEAMSDIYGSSVAFYATPEKGDNNWLVGWESYTPATPGDALRYMNNPNAGEQPDTYGGTYWQTGDSDNGGVHTNSGVMNYAYYLMVAGGSGTNDHGLPYSVAPIDRRVVQQIIYRALSVYMTPSTNFIACRWALIMAVNDLYGVESVERATVLEAMKAVGVYSQQIPVSIVAAQYIEPGTGGYYILNGTNVGESWTGILSSDEPVSIEAVPPEGYIFYKWSDYNTSNPRNFMPVDPIRAIYKTHLASTNPNATKGQQRIYSNADGTKYGLVYESAGYIWYSEYDVNTGIWSKEQREGGVAYSDKRDPSTCIVNDMTYITYERDLNDDDHPVQLLSLPYMGMQDIILASDPPKTVMSYCYNPVLGRDQLILVFHYYNDDPTQDDDIMITEDDDSYPFNLNHYSSVSPALDIIDFNVSQAVAGSDRVTICYTTATSGKLHSFDYVPTSILPTIIVPASDNVPLSSSYGAYNGTTSVRNARVLRYDGKTLYCWIEEQSYADRNVAFVCYQERKADGTWDDVKVFDMYASVGSEDPNEVTSLTMTRASGRSVLVWSVGNKIYHAWINGSAGAMDYTGYDGYNPQLSVSEGNTPPDDVRFIYRVNTSSPYMMALGNISPLMDITISVVKGWNLVSVPVLVPDLSVGAIFPTVFGGIVFTYNKENGGYIPAATLEYGVGYWAYFPEAQDIVLWGGGINSLSIEIAKNWNMVGSISYPVPIENVVTIPPTFIVWYGYQNGGYYMPESIQPGVGYWAYNTSPSSCTALLEGPVSLPKESVSSTQAGVSISAYDKFTITDGSGNRQSLFVANLEREPVLAQMNLAMPPAFSEAKFDARFESGEMIKAISSKTQTELGIAVKAEASIVDLTWELKAENGFSYEIVTEGTQVAKEVSATGSMSITIPSDGKIHMRAIGSNKAMKSDLPSEYALQQNYPNPFNPVTTIKYQLPERAGVRLEVFNMLGQRVAMLVNAEQEAGYYQVPFDAKALSSGIYFYRISAGSYVNSQKMMLLR